jgi:pyrophosphate--fructose-6-phosphate 1-phosphotransferase
MPGKYTISIEDLLQKPEVEKAVSNINQELTERRQYSPPKCEVFSHPYTALREDAHYIFFIDNEARKELPSIIDNKVQAVVGLDSPEESFKEKYCKKRNIGIVFSGGPALLRQPTLKTRYTVSSSDRTE